ncbi:MAG: hypothetical protein KDK39_04590 [Leptospiraceae bacterium]|nr:hypothetical protein [Leptospiraceae bacterium]
MRFFALGILCLAGLPLSALSAQESVARTKHEIGLWVGASNPMPGTRTDEILDANVGGGGFYRINWPWVFHTEFGAAYANYFSHTTQQVIVAPTYLALAYRLPYSFKLQTWLKLGGGGAWLEVRPENRSGWEPLFFAGLEFSIPASRVLRVGLRLDYNLIYEKHLKPPPGAELYYPGSTDPRFQRDPYSLNNGHFFHFGLMVGFTL